MNRPPRKWWYDTVKKLKKIPRISDPAKVTGWLWYHHLTPEMKIKQLTKKDLQRELAKYYTGLKGHNAICRAYEEQTEKEKETESPSFGKGSRMKKRPHKKKKLTAKQKHALKQGRKILKHLRTGRKVSEDKEPIIIKEGSLMSGKKRGKKGKRHSGEPEGMGMEGRKKGKREKRGRYLHGAADGFKPLDLATDGIALLTGALIGGFTGNLIPIKNSYVKALAPLGLGVVTVSIPQLSKVRFMNRAALGSITVALVSMLRNLWPKAPLLSGETAETVAAAIDNLDDEQRAVMGLIPARETAGDDGDEESDGMGAVPYSETAGDDGAFIPEDAPLSPAHM